MGKSQLAKRIESLLSRRDHSGVRVSMFGSTLAIIALSVMFAGSLWLSPLIVLAEGESASASASTAVGATTADRAADPKPPEKSGNEPASPDVSENLKEDLAARRQQLENAELARRQLLRNHQASSIDEARSVATQALRQYQELLRKAESAAATARSRAEETSKLLRSGIQVDTLPDVTASPAIQGLTKELALAAADLAALKKRFKLNHPTITSAEQRVSSLRNSLESEAGKLVEGIRSCAVIAESEEASLRKLFERQREESRRLENLAAEETSLSREVQEKELLYKAALFKLQDPTGANGSVSSQSPDRKIEVLIDSSGRLYIGSRRLTESDLKKELLDINTGGDREPVLSLVFNTTASLGVVVRAIDLAKQTGITSVTLRLAQ